VSLAVLEIKRPRMYLCLWRRLIARRGRHLPAQNRTGVRDDHGS
jgi:hypothetical protein